MPNRCPYCCSLRVAADGSCVECGRTNRRVWNPDDYAIMGNLMTKEEKAQDEKESEDE